MYALEESIRRLNEEERRLEMELLDVMCHVETPSTSEDEDPDAPIQNPPTTGQIYQLLLNMLAVVSTLGRDTAYSDLYNDRQYLKNVEKKLKKMKKNAKKVNFEAIYRDPTFASHLNEICQTYSDDGGRAYLRYLVALECYIITELSTESDTDNESEPEEFVKKPKKDFDNNDNGNQGGQMIMV